MHLSYCVACRNQYPSHSRYCPRCGRDSHAAPRPAEPPGTPDTKRVEKSRLEHNFGPHNACWRCGMGRSIAERFGLGCR